MLDLPYAVSFALTHVALALPDMYLWWDPRVKEQQRPATAYPWFSTRALAQTMRIGENVHAQAARAAPAAQSIVLVTNAHDPAVNNKVAHGVALAWNKRKPGCALEFAFGDLPRNHDIIEPDNPHARTDVVYPRLLEFILGTP
jgi:hypothetical protein